MIYPLTRGSAGTFAVFRLRRKTAKVHFGTERRLNYLNCTQSRFWHDNAEMRRTPWRSFLSYCFSIIAACAAASLAIGTLNGEQLT